MMAFSIPEIITPNKSKGSIQVIYGPMFSGKTTELIRRMKRYELANYDCLVVKYAKDIRYAEDDIATHDSQGMKASVSATVLMDHFKVAMKNDVIGVDEGQFFPDIIEFCEKLADSGKIVIVAALDGSYLREGFGDILQLVPLAESVMKLNAVCMMCYGEASFTKRRGSEKQVEVIGGTDKYLAVCRECYKLSPSKSPAPRFKERALTEINQAEKQAVGKNLFKKTSGCENVEPMQS